MGATTWQVADRQSGGVGFYRPAGGAVSEFLYLSPGVTHGKTGRQKLNIH
jgi:hypothetical protein